MAEEKILRDVAQWLSPADLRRARLVCKTWYGALATLTTKAATPAESLVPQWKGQLEAMLQAFPCLQELTIVSRLSSVAAQQLGVLTAAKQLQALNIPQAQALQDRSLLALQPLAPNLRQLRMNGASSLSKRSLLLLSVLANLEVLELKNCGKVSWLELQQAWRAACMAYEAQAAAEGGVSNAGTHASSSSGGGSSRFSSNGGGFGSKLGAWLPTGRLFRTSSPASNSIQSALAWQRTGTSSLFAKVHDMARGTGTSSAAAIAVAQLGIGAVGNGRSSCGGSMPEAPARSLLYRKQKEDAAAASGTSLALSEEPILEAQAVGQPTGSGCFPVRTSLLRMRATKSAISAADMDSPRPISMLSRVGSLVWHSSSAASAGLGSSSSDSFVGSSGSSLAAQASSVHAALLAYIAQEQQTAHADGASTEFLPGPNSPVSRARKGTAAAKPDNNSSGSGEGSSGGSGGVATNRGTTAAQVHCASSGEQPAQSAVTGAPAAASSSLVKQSSKPPALSVPEPAQQQQHKTRRRTTAERALPAMPFTKLASLAFTCSEVTLKNPGPELAAVAALTSLTSLDIGKCKLPDAVFANLQSLSRLRKLKLSGLWSMGDAGLQHVAQISTLQSLALSEAMHVSAQGLCTLTSLSRLTSLALGFTQDLGPGVLAPVINSLPLLQCVEIAAPCWCDLDFELLAEARPSTPEPPGSGSAGGSMTPIESAAAGAGDSSSTAVPQMLWDLAGGSFSQPSSRTNSTRQVLPPAAGRAAGSGWSLRNATSFGSMRSRSFGSFGSFSVHAGGSQLRPPAALPPAQPLLVMRLHGCRALTSRGMAALRQLSGLHTLVLEDCKEVRAAEVISQGLLPPKLESLTFKNLPFGNVFSGCVSIPACASRLTKLELVSLEAAHEGQLRRLLSFFTNLSELSLAGCVELGDAVVPHVGLLPRLQQLSLGGCSISGHGLEHLATLPKLRVLSLKACAQLSDEGLQHLLLLPALEVLDLSECGAVSEQGLLHVAQGAPRLVQLELLGCKAVSRGLLAACPHYLGVRHSL